MTPNELSVALNKIASKIDASANPSRELVLADLHHVLASMEVEAGSHEAGILTNAKKLLPALFALVGLKGGLEAGEHSAKADAEKTQRVKMTSEALEKLGKAVKAKGDAAFTPRLEQEFRRTGLPTELTLVLRDMSPEQVDKIMLWEPGKNPARAALSNGGYLQYDSTANTVHIYPDKNHNSVVDVNLDTLKVSGPESRKLE